MSAPKDGGFAFPCDHEMLPEHANTDDIHAARGMTLRDWFAGQALAGMLANPASKEIYSHEIVAHAYKGADLMLMERTK